MVEKVNIENLTNVCLSKICNAKKIDKYLFSKGDLFSKTLFAYYLNKSELLKKLSNVGVVISDSNFINDFELLVEINKKGLDLKGVFIGNNNESVFFDFSKIVDSISISKNDLIKNEILFY